MRKVEPGWWVRARHKLSLAKAHKFVASNWLYPLCTKGSAEEREALLPISEVKKHRHVAFCSLCFDIADTLDALDDQPLPAQETEVSK